MKKFFCWIVAVALVALLPALGRAAENPKTVYFARVTDTKGQTLLLSDIVMCPGPPNSVRPRDGWDYFDIRRGDTGSQLPFSRVSAIEITGQFGKPIEIHMSATITLTSGSTVDAYILAGYRLAGQDETIGSTTSILFKDVRKVEFLHDGTFKTCPLCKTRFYKSELAKCPFDKQTLE